MKVQYNYCKYTKYVIPMKLLIMIKLYVKKKNSVCSAGATYFFKGKGFWKFNDLRMKVEKTEQSPSAQFWMKCPQVNPLSQNKYIYLNF